jgi:hypothetical protein
MFNENDAWQLFLMMIILKKETLKDWKIFHDRKREHTIERLTEENRLL